MLVFILLAKKKNQAFYFHRNMLAQKLIEMELIKRMEMTGTEK